MREEKKPIKQIVQEAKAMERAGNYEGADAFLSDAISELLLQRGVTRRMLRRYDDAFADFEDVLLSAQTSDQSVEAYVGLADVSRVGRNDFPIAHRYLDQAMDIFSSGNVAYARAMNQRGLVFEAEKMFGSAQPRYEAAINLLYETLEKNPGDEEARINLARTLTNYGSALENDNKFDQALKAHSDALRTFEELGDQQGMFNGVIGIGRIVLRSGDVTKALEHYKRAEKIMQKTGYERGMAAVNLHIADAYLTLRDTESARPYIEKLIAGVRADHLTEHDREVFMEMFRRIAVNYSDQNVVEGSEEVRRMFLGEESPEPS